MLKLIIEDDEGRKTVIPFARDEITIGRAEGNTIRLTERNVSRRHARLLRQNGHVLVEDLGSANGVRVNGDRVVGKESLRGGDLVQIGDYAVALSSEEEQETSRTDETGPIEVGDEVQDTATHNRVTATTVPFAQPVDSGDSDASADSEPTDQSSRQELPASSSPDPRYEATGVIRGDQLQPKRPREQRALAPHEAPRLVALNTELAGHEFPCTRTEQRVGRVDDNDICIDHRSLSRTHCKLVREDNGDWRVIDLQSANGILVNGEAYKQVTLHFGDVLELGHLKLKFVEPGATPTRLQASAPLPEETPAPPPPAAGQGHRRALVALGAVVLLLIVAAGALVVWRLQEQLAGANKPVRQASSGAQGSGATTGTGASRSLTATGPVTQHGDAGAEGTKRPSLGEGDSPVAAGAEARTGAPGENSSPRDAGAVAAPVRSKEELTREAERVLSDAMNAMRKGELDGAKELLGTCKREGLPCQATRVRQLEITLSSQAPYLEALIQVEDLIAAGELERAKTQLAQAGATKMDLRWAEIKGAWDKAFDERLRSRNEAKAQEEKDRAEAAKQKKEAEDRARQEAEEARRREDLAKESSAIAAFVARAAEANDDKVRDYRRALEESKKCVNTYPKAYECYQQCYLAATKQVTEALSPDEAKHPRNRALWQDMRDCAGKYLEWSPSNDPGRAHAEAVRAGAKEVFKNP